MRYVMKAAPAPGADQSEFVMSDETVDRIGDVIDASGWKLENFRRHPIALFNHDRNQVIGQWADVRVEGTRLIGRLELAKEDPRTPIVNEVRALHEQGLLRAVSVGFDPIEMEPINSKDPWGPQRFTKQELLECSLVAVPANPNALILSTAKHLPREVLAAIVSKPANDDVDRSRAIIGKPAKSLAREGAIMSKHEQRIGELRNQINQQRDRLAILQNEDVLSLADQKEFAELPASLELAISTLRDYEAAERAQALAAQLDQNKTPATIARPAIIRDLSRKKVNRAADHIIRAMVITGLAYHTKAHPDQLLRDHYGGDEDTGIILKTAHLPAQTGVAGWAAELIVTTVSDFVDLLMPDFIYPKLASYGLRLTFGPYGKISIPTRTASQLLSGDFVGEGLPIPVREASFTPQSLTPRKLAIITTFTREMSLHSIPSIEGILREALVNDTGKLLDTRLIDNVALSATRPAGLLNGVTPITAASGGGLAAFIADMGAIMGAFYNLNAGRSIVLIMNKADALRASLLTSSTGDFVFDSQEAIRQKFMISQIVTSTTVPAKTVIAVDALDFASATGDAPQFDISNQATLHMDDAPTAIGTVGAPATVAAPTRSLWQTDTIGVRMIMDVSWLMRRAGMVQTIANVTW